MLALRVAQVVESRENLLVSTKTNKMNFLSSSSRSVKPSQPPKGANQQQSGSRGVKSTLLSSPDRVKFETVPAEVNVNTDMIVQNDCQVEDSKSNQDEIEQGETDVFKELENWLLKNGASFPDLYLKQYADGVRGVHAQTPIRKFVRILSIPPECLITDYMGRTQTQIGRKLFSSKFTLASPNLIAVILYILTTREDPNHFFQPYYRILPKSYSNFPIFWGKEKLAWLQGSPLINDIIERKKSMRGDYDEICRLCPEFKRYSFQEFLEIRTAVGSRNFGIIMQGEKRTAMVPYADMLNHFRPRETSWTYDNSCGAFTITSLSAMEAGQQVMDSYGKKCNSKFFLHYGFAVEWNREEDGKCQNELLFKLGLSSSIDDPLRDTRISFLGLQRGTRGYRISMNIEDNATNEAFSFLRVKVATEHELNQMLARHASGISTSQRHASPGSKIPHVLVDYLSPSNEANALEKLAQYCTRQLQMYPNSYDENLALFRSGTVAPFTDRRTALVVILCEQEICHFWINAANTLCPHLRNKEGSELKDALRTLPRETFPERDLARYAKTLIKGHGGM